MAPQRRSYREQRRLRLQTAVIVTGLIVPGTFYILGLTGIHPTSLGGALIVLGVALFLWRFWRSTLAMIEMLKVREREERRKQQEEQPVS
ncbi:MAG: hypothetical protein HC876_09850 [Chloroflexaceae bacterium]|nr:hypothetical protein [Chloroflexaceae bacterium]NJO05789.1 hypothetical protein [Chloroflexaceae bacterium]